MKPETYNNIRQVVKAFSGLDLGEDKEYLVRSRFNSMIDEHKVSNIDELVQWLIQNNDNWKQIMAEQLATHETYFFRDPVLYDDIRDVVLPDLAKKDTVKVWSAAASSGQEIYTLAMMLEMERHRIPSEKFKLFASDFSEAALQRAKDGKYTHYEVQRGLPAKYLISFFKKEENSWVISDAIKERISFFQCNLQNDGAAFPNADFVLLRNVLIYFDLENRKRILEKVYKSMNAGGILVLGSSETLFGLTTGFAKVPNTRSIIYKKV